MEADQIGGHLADLLEATRDAERQLFAAIDRSRRDAPPADGGWSRKDVQVHIFVWKLRQADRLARAERGELLEGLADGEIDTINADEHDRHADWPWDRVDAVAESATSDLVSRVRAARFEEPELAALLGGCVGNGCEHVLEHLFSAPHGQRDGQLLTGLEERLALLVADGLLPDAVAGTTIYNQACRRALAGQLDSAREKLRTAFGLNPDLLEWAAHDTEVQALWGELLSLAGQ